MYSRQFEAFGDIHSCGGGWDGSQTWYKNPFVAYFPDKQKPLEIHQQLPPAKKKQKYK